MIYTLVIVDKMFVPILTNESNTLLEKNNLLREKIEDLISFKNFVDTNEHKFD